MCGEHRRVVSAADILLRPALATGLVSFPTDGLSALLVEFSSLLLGEEFPVCILGWALQRDLAVARPDALQVGFAPRRAWRLRDVAGTQLQQPNRRRDDRRHADHREKSSAHRYLLMPHRRPRNARDPTAFRRLQTGTADLSQGLHKSVYGPCSLAVGCARHDLPFLAAAAAYGFPDEVNAL